MSGGAICPQFGDESPPNLKRAPKGGSEGSPKGSRKAERREAERTLQGGIEGWERAPQGERDRSGQEDPTEMVRGASRRLPWSRRGRLGRGLSDTIPARCQRPIADVAPRSTGGFGRTVTRGCVASGAMRSRFASSSRRSVLRPHPMEGNGREGPRHAGAEISPEAGQSRCSAQRGPEPGRALAGRHLAVELGLDQGEVVGVGHADAAALAPAAR